MEQAQRIKKRSLEEGVKTSIITRKIRLFIDVPSDNKDELNRLYKRLYSWQDIVFKASNLVTSHLYIQEQAKELLYFHEDIKLKLTDRKIDEKGMLNTSQNNSTYRIIAQKFKNELPSSIATCLNYNIFSTFSKEKSQYFTGERSLRSYRSNIPVPISADSILDLRYDKEINNFRFSLFKIANYKIPFRTSLGRDLSKNKTVLEKCLTGEYDVCNSAYTILNGKIYLFLVVKIPILKHKLNYDSTTYASLSFLAPIIVSLDDKSYHIGDKESYLYKRLAIQQGLKRRQELMKYNSGGRGRKKKTQGIDEFKAKEKQFVENFTHNLSTELVKFCIAHKIGKLELREFEQTIEEATTNPFVLRNWSYGNLRNKIEYKCKMNDIIVGIS
jgi:hypothetical protein